MDKNMEHDMETAVMLRVLLFCMRFVVSVVLEKKMWFAWAQNQGRTGSPETYRVPPKALDTDPLKGVIGCVYLLPCSSAYTGYNEDYTRVLLYSPYTPLSQGGVSSKVVG